MIYVTGDTHGSYNGLMRRLSGIEMTDDDLLIICGDFGFIWNDEETIQDFEKLKKTPLNIAFIDGNHEDFPMIEKYPVEDWNGGRVHRITDRIVHLMRGHVFTINGAKFFAMGGAYSVDRAFRSFGRGWWNEELPSAEEYATAAQSLEKNDNTVDYVITHTVPDSIIYSLHRPPSSGDKELTGYFERLYRNLKFRKWFAGHFHVNEHIGDNFTVLLDMVEKL